MPNITNITPPRVAIVDVKTGYVSREWYRWFYNLYVTVGGPDQQVLQPDRGGTGTSTIPKNGQILVGNSVTHVYDVIDLGVGSGIGKTIGPGILSIENTGVLSFSAGTTGLTPISATTGDVILDGTLNVSNGGTGQVSFSNGELLIGDSTGNTLVKSTLTAGTGVTIVNGNGSITISSAYNGDVVGPSSATDNAIARFDGTTGKLIQNSPVTIDDAGNIISPDSVQFSGTVPVTQPTGTLWFDSSNDSLNFQQNAITQQIGEEIFVYGKASAAISGQTILQAIYKTGVVGASSVVTFAPTVAGITDTGAIIGIATEDIAHNGFGRITSFGVIHGINTTGSTYGETWVDGQDIWYNPVTGGLTKTKPTAPNQKFQVGTVINAGPGGSGSFQVLLQPGSVLGGTDSNVQLGTLANNDLLQYDSVAQYWKNVPASTVVSGAGGAPVTKTADFTVAVGETWLINNKSGSTCTVTLPTASSFTGRVLYFQNYQAYTVVSASSNVVPLVGGAASTAILAAVAGDTATLVSDGTNWVMTQYTPNNVLLLE